MPVSNRLVALAASWVIAGGLAACGSSDDDVSKAGDPTQTDTAAAPAQGADDSGGAGKAGIASLVEGMYRDMAAGDAEGVCSVMSAAARQQIARNAPGGGTGTTCRKSLSVFLEAAANSGTLQETAGATVERVVIRGRTATAIVALGGVSGPVSLLKENGVWRLGDDSFAPGK